MKKAPSLEDTKHLIEEDLVRHWDLYMIPQELEDIETFRVYFQYMPEAYLPSPPLDMTKAPEFREFEAFMRIITIKQKATEFTKLTETYLQDLNAIYRVRRRVIDAIWLVDSKHPIDPLVVKLSTGVTLVPVDIDLLAIVEKINSE